eukprot:CAMPEP_0185755980 /NCGR_PEP_ID=MMETSP1174-20130828/14447_1 /TAXON_ID=35687 /ORGANISM="Dictyocha speculum, Strain CCMP1381" /LENGTH=537 /DNA_ID=CAMNT_0028434755 /DNA_START=36 /DNA_END=1646 /DNA_ORIENTATION=+
MWSKQDPFLSTHLNEIERIERIFEANDVPKFHAAVASIVGKHDSQRLKGEDGLLSEEDLQTLLLMSAQFGNWKYALHLLARIRIIGRVPSAEAFNAAMLACCKGEQWHKIPVLHTTFKGTHPNPKETIYASVLLLASQAAAKTGHPTRALQMLKKSQSLAESLVDQSMDASLNNSLQLTPLTQYAAYPQLVHFEAVLVAYAEQRACKRVLEVLGLMTDSLRHRSNQEATKGDEAADLQHIYIIAIACCVSTGHYAEAVEVYDQRLKNKKNTVTPDLAMAKLVAKAYAQTGQWQTAMDLLKGLSARADLGLYSDVTAACCRAGECKPALKTLKAMRRLLFHILEIDGRGKKTGKRDKPPGGGGGEEDEGGQQGQNTTLVDRTRDELDPHTTAYVTSLVMVTNACKNSNPEVYWKRSLSLLRDLVRNLAPSPSLLPPEVFVAVAQTCRRAQRHREAVEVVRLVEDSDVVMTPEMYTMVLGVLERAHRSAKALEVIEEMMADHNSHLMESNGACRLMLRTLASDFMMMDDAGSGGGGGGG